MELLPLHGSSTKLEDYILQPELTWTGDAFEKDLWVVVSALGTISQVVRKAEASPIFKKGLKQIALKGFALIPGMVNAHSHAFQRGLRGLGEVYPKDSEKGSFWTWREEMYGLVDSMDSNKMLELTKQCFSEMRDAGITSVGEFHYFHHGNDAKKRFEYDEKILEAARQVGIRLVLLNAFYEFGGFNRAPMSNPQKRFKISSHDEYWNQMSKLEKKLSATQSLGVVAHSMRAVELDDLVKLHQESQKRKLVFHMHLEEQQKEIDDCKQANGGNTPMQLILEKCKVDEKFTAVHCTWTEPKLLKEYVNRKANVCICPLTEGNLGDGFPSIANCLERICLGSDCNARIDMCEEMRWLEYAHRLHQSRRGVICDGMPDTDMAKLLFRYATTNGAASLNLKVGEIKPGFAADFALIDLNEEQLRFATKSSLLAAFVFGCNGSSVIKATSVNGLWRETQKHIVKATKLADIAPLPAAVQAEIAAASKLADPTSNDVVALTCGLMNIQSSSGDEANAGQAIQKWLTARGWKVEAQRVPPQPDAAVQKERFNIYASPTGTKTPRLLFNSHMDTVPPFLPARIDDVKIYGRGSCDAKGQVAAQMLAAERLAKEGFENDVAVLFVVSEETDHSGMKKANELGLKPQHLIVGEPTGMKMVKLQKGVLKVRLVSKGVAAHSGYPHLGESAIDPLIEVLHDLNTEQWPSSEELGSTTLNIGTISGGQAANALAESASAMLMFRLTVEPDTILKRVEEIVGKRCEVELYTSNAPVHLSVVPGYPTDVASFNTDIPYFKFDGKAYLFGAGFITDAHCSREYINLKDLRQLVTLYHEVGKKLLTKNK